MITYRESRVLKGLLEGKSQQQALLDAGFSPSLAKNPGFIISDEMREQFTRLQAELVANTLQAGLIDAQEIHEYLTDALRAKITDIKNDDGSYKPLSEWPEIWQRLYEEGHVEVEMLTERSHDNADKDGKGGWDIVGQVRKVKFKFTSRAKLLELAMRHKGINAMVEAKQGDVNIVVITAEKARQVAGAKKRLKAITVKSEKIDE